MTLKRGNILQHMHGSKHNPNSPLKQTQEEMDQLKSSPSRSQSKEYKKTFFDPHTKATKSISDWAEKSHATTKMFAGTKATLTPGMIKGHQESYESAKEKAVKIIKGGQGSKTFGL